ncbi:hypothetical protein KI387_039067, partial [Taxus chinensis]
MAPKKAPATGVKGKKKVEVEEEIAPESNFSEMQYPEGVIVGQEWDSHIHQCKINDYNHRTSDNKKELDALLNTKTKKHTTEDMLIYDDT